MDRHHFVIAGASEPRPVVVLCLGLLAHVNTLSETIAPEECLPLIFLLLCVPTLWFLLLCVPTLWAWVSIGTFFNRPWWPVLILPGEIDNCGWHGHRGEP